MAVVKNLMVRSGADFSGLYKETKKAQQQLTDFKSKVSGTMKAIGAALATAGIGMLVKDAVNVAMSVEASIQQITRLMGANAAEFLKWANTQSAAYGMAKSEALKYGAVYGNLLSTFTKSTTETMKYTEELLKASAVVASGTGRTIEDVMDRIRSGLLGNTEAIEDLGINVNVAMLESTEAFKKFANGKSWQQLSFQTQQQIRLFAIMEQASKKYGDGLFDNTSSAQLMFTSQLKDLQLAFGQAFLPIYNIVLPALTSMAAKMVAVMETVSRFMEVLFGKEQKQQKQQVNVTTQQTNAVDDLGDAYKKTGEKAKKAKGALAGFDEVNTLSDSSGSGSGLGVDAGGVAPGTAGATEGPVEQSGIDAGVSALANKVRQAFQTIRSIVAENKDYIISAIAGILTAFASFAIISNWAAIVVAFKAALAGLSAGIIGLSAPIVAIAVVIGLFAANIVYLWRTNDEFRKSVIDIWNKIKTFFVTVISDMWSSAQRVWDKYGQTLIDNLKGFMKSFQDIILAVWVNWFQPVISNVIDVLSELWTNHLSGLVEQIMTFVMKLANAALEIWNKFVGPVMVYLLEKLGPVFTTVFNGIIKIIGSLLGVVADVAKGLFKALGGVIDFLLGTFTGDWKKAWQGVKDIFGGIFDSLKSLVKPPLNFIIDMVNKVIDGINAMIKGLNKVPGVTIPTVPAIPRLAKGGITNGPMIAMIGDNPGGQEVVSPLDDLMGMIATAVASAMQFHSGNSKQGDIVLQIDGTTIARVLGPYNEKESARIGGSMIATT